MSLERSPVDEAKESILPLKKWKCQKFQRLTYFFKKQLYIHKFVIKKWVNRRHFFIDEKNFQKFCLTAEVISV